MVRSIEFAAWVDVAGNSARRVRLEHTPISSTVKSNIGVWDAADMGDDVELLVGDTGLQVVHRKKDRKPVPQWILTVQLIKELEIFNGPFYFREYAPHLQPVPECILCNAASGCDVRLNVDRESIGCTKCSMLWHDTCLEWWVSLGRSAWAA